MNNLNLYTIQAMLIVLVLHIFDRDLGFPYGLATVLICLGWSTLRDYMDRRFK